MAANEPRVPYDVVMNEQGEEDEGSEVDNRSVSPPSYANCTGEDDAARGWRFLTETARDSYVYPDGTYELKKTLDRQRRTAALLHGLDAQCTDARRHMEIEDHLFRYWLSNRHALYTSDEPYKRVDEDDNVMIYVSALIPWLTLAHLFALRTEEGTTPAYLARCEDRWRAWTGDYDGRAMDILCNDEGDIVCDVAPYMHTVQDIRNILNLFSRQWRTYTYAHVPALKVYITMLLRRCLLFAVGYPDGVGTTSSFVYECEMQLFAMTYQCFVLSKFQRASFEEWPGYVREEYDDTRACVEAWLQYKTKHGKFDQIGTEFRRLFEETMVMPGERERLARQRAVPREEIVTTEILQESRPDDYMRVLEMFKYPLLSILHGERGGWLAQQLITIVLIDMYLQSVNWHWRETHIVMEDVLFDKMELRRLRFDSDRVVMAQLFNGFVVVVRHEGDPCATYYTCNDFIGVLTQFVLLTRDSGIAIQHNSFYSHVDCRLRARARTTENSTRQRTCDRMDTTTTAATTTTTTTTTIDDFDVTVSDSSVSSDSLLDSDSDSL